ncbi:hypothetical protein HPC49_47960 [Pyxidicoccus fallax]|uniref:Uncharacterized protein n=1 Tax=Pyxidicoccus fallax TaxID=394095 RepID=A0A848LWH3_9BACT|nr:hypothetical protein [Pyxidicoccus fallax]NMO22375.1 hypothetical protein [Pyxidicoccus fallax]NPC85907.1 hypothetical protein [Pyxidicoccus fallax]
MSDTQTGGVPSGGRRRKIPYHARPLPPRLPLPTGSVLDACPYLDLVDRWLTNVGKVQELVVACGYAPSAYWQEALIHRYGDTRLVSDEEWNWLSAQPLGVHERHPLFKLRQTLVEIAEAAHPPAISEEDTLVIWGAPSPRGKPFYRTAGVLLRSERLRKAVEWRPEDGLSDYLDFIRAWAQASGVGDGNTLRGLEGLLARFRDNLLNEHPEKSFVSLGRDSLEWVRLVSQTHGPRAAYYLFRCLQRLAAYMRKDTQAQGWLARWRSTWLRGSRTNPDAIPGASTHAQLLTDLLRTHVFEPEPYEGYSAGRKATTYRLKWVPDTGSYTEEDAARRLGLELRDGKPVRSNKPARFN